jgi:hypothetical protein
VFSEWTSIDMPLWGWACWLAIGLAVGVYGVYRDFITALGLHLGLRRGIRLHPSRLIFALIICAFWMLCAAKGPVPGHAMQYVTALRDGRIIDPSGLVSRTTELAVIDAYNAESDAIVAAATQAVVSAQYQFDEASNLITGSVRKVWYISSDLPRVDPQVHTNANIAATVERTRQSADGSVLSQWVWFSEQPATNPTVVAEIDIGAGWLRLTSVTNTYPDTEDVGGVPCVRYDYLVPEGARKVVFWPRYELGFGSEAAPLIVPRAGIVVTVGQTQYYPFTGDDWLLTNLLVRTSGGVAYEAVLNGVVCSNNAVYEVPQ